VADIHAGRRAYDEGAWRQAHTALSAADRAGPLGAEDLERLGRAAYMLGHDDEYVSALERAHHAHLEDGDAANAVRCAFWIGHSWLFRGELVRAMGWFGRAQRALEASAEECVEQGWLLIPVWLDQMAHGDYETGYATASEAVRIAERFGDPDLMWLARDEQARGLLHLGRIKEGLRLVTEVLVATASGELSPVVTGIVYCNTILFCHAAYQLRHTREWTQALTTWCDRQPEMVAHNGLCLVHRAELMQLRGAWSEALQEARRAAERFNLGVLNALATGEAIYRQAEILRLRGAYPDAEDTYRRASRHGYDPQPGLALLRLAQSNHEAAAAAIRRAVAERTDPLERARLLPAYVEIMLAVGEHDRAAAACKELDDTAQRHSSDWLAAKSAHAQAAVALASDDAKGALERLRRAWRLYQELEATYDAACARVLIAQACRAVGDTDTAELELEAALDVFEQLEAVPDVVRIEALLSRNVAGDTHGLTEREREVLRLVRIGKSNRDIATKLSISEHTVARHLQNIFVKFDVTSRTAASAYAFEHDIT